MLGSARGAIVHRYAFDGDPNDSVGSANGVLIRHLDYLLPQSYYADGQLILGNNGTQNSNAAGGTSDGDYVDLPNGIISALGDQATFEIWTTWRGSAMWERIFDMGKSDGVEDSSGGGANSHYIFLSPRGGSEQLRFGMNNPVPTRVEITLDDPAGNLPINTEQHIVISWDGAGKSVKMFRNGELVDEGQMHFALSDIPDINNWLGRAQWPDTMYVGSFNEFRIYDHAMTANEVAASLAAGTEKSPASPVSPVGGTKEVGLLPTLEWAQGVLPDGSTGLMYTLYFSNNEAAVQARSTDAKANDFPETVTSLAMPAELLTDQTYYWVVDETVTLPGMSEPNIIAGGVVSFETIKTLPILTAPAFGYGIAGQSATLTVSIATGSDIAGCAWYKYVDGANDVALSDGDKYAIACSNEKTTLTIAEIAAEDAGTYYCTVENAAGTETSANLALYVRNGLVHRYSFDGNASPADPNVVDSVSGKNGTLVIRTPALNTRYEDGMLILGNNGGQSSNSGTGDYVDLPNGMISALGNLATFEMWVGWRGSVNQAWQRIFDLGTSNGGENDSSGAGNAYYVMMSPRSGNTTYRVGYRRGPSADERTIDMGRGPLPADNELVHVAVVWDGANGVIKSYYNGKPVAQGALHFALSDMPDNNNWLGRAQWNDAMFTGRYDEFRIYDVPLDDNTILAHYQAGPNVIGADLPCTAYPEADANGDCKVDLGDLGVMADTWLTCGGPVCQ
jgi:hypothetical protein